MHLNISVIVIINLTELKCNCCMNTVIFDSDFVYVYGFKGVRGQTM